MPSSTFAPTTAPSRTVVGPFVTAFGFRSWYWVCVPDAIIAVPQGLTPDVILETIDGKKLAYGIGAQDYEEASARLRQMYPNLCKSF